jgi:hypothetical protein
VAWPFPIIFTGGVVPGLWRPIVGIDAFDLKEDEIDITPWLPLLCDGNAHTFEIQVTGLNDSSNGAASLSETTASYWLVTGKVFIWLDVEGHITTPSLILDHQRRERHQRDSTIPSRRPTQPLLPVNHKTLIRKAESLLVPTAQLLQHR